MRKAEATGPTVSGHGGSHFVTTAVPNLPRFRTLAQRICFGQLRDIEKVLATMARIQTAEANKSLS